MEALINANKNFYGKSRTQFMAQKEAITALLDEGYPMTVIWKSLNDKGTFDAKYDQFVAYVRKIIRPGYKEKGDLDRKKESVELVPKHSHGEHTTKGPRIAFEREPKKTDDWNISTIGKEYLLEPAKKS